MTLAAAARLQAGCPFSQAVVPLGFAQVSTAVLFSLLTLGNMSFLDGQT